MLSCKLQNISMTNSLNASAVQLLYDSLIKLRWSNISEDNFSAPTSDVLLRQPDEVLNEVEVRVRVVKERVRIIRVREE